MEGARRLCSSWEGKKARTSKLAARQLNEKLDTVVEDSEAEENSNTQPLQSATKKTFATPRNSTKRIAGVVAKWEGKKARTSKLTAQQLNEKLDTIVEDSEAEEDGKTQPPQSATKKTSATSRGSTKRIAGVVAKWVNTSKPKLLHEMAFQGVLDLPQINTVDPEFTFWLLRRVDPTKRILWIDDITYVPIRDVDYSRVLGIPCGKLPVCGLDSKDPEDKIDFINLCIGRTGGKQEYCSLKAAELNVEKQYHEPMDKVQCDNFKVSFVVWLVCRWLAPIKKPNNGSETFWGALLKPDEISCYNWCAFALEALFDAVHKFQHDITLKIKIGDLSLCPMFLQIFFLDYVKNGGLYQPARIPRIADYENQTISSMIQALNEKLQREAVLNNTIKESEACTLDSFQKAIGASKLPIKRKIALRWYGARLQRHILLLRSSIFRDASALVEKLEAEEGTGDEGSGGLGIKRIADGYTRGSEHMTEDGSGARKESAFRDKSFPTFSLGLSNDDEDEPTPSVADGHGTTTDRRPVVPQDIPHHISPLRRQEQHQGTDIKIPLHPRTDARPPHDIIHRQMPPQIRPPLPPQPQVCRRSDTGGHRPPHRSLRHRQTPPQILPPLLPQPQVCRRPVARGHRPPHESVRHRQTPLQICPPLLPQPQICRHLGAEVAGQPWHGAHGVAHVPGRLPSGYPFVHHQYLQSPLQGGAALRVHTIYGENLQRQVPASAPPVPLVQILRGFPLVSFPDAVGAAKW